MLVSELITILKQCPPNYEVMIDTLDVDYEIANIEYSDNQTRVCIRGVF
jgi:hypothetical protein